MFNNIADFEQELNQYDSQLNDIMMDKKIYTNTVDNTTSNQNIPGISDKQIIDPHKSIKDQVKADLDKEKPSLSKA